MDTEKQYARGFRDATTHIYTLVDPRTQLVRYVGKADDLEERYQMHLYEKHNNHKCHWVQNLLKQGLSPELHCRQVVPVYRWQEAEAFWICAYRNAGHPLTNLTEGGEGTSGRKATAAQRKAQSDRQKGKTAWNKGLTGIYSQETRQQISEGVKQAQTICGNGFAGKRHSVETRKLLSEQHLAMPPVTEAFRQKMSKVTSGSNNGMFGRAQSASARAKMRAVHALRRKSKE